VLGDHEPEWRELEHAGHTLTPEHA
jgi:hypothetical protein